MLPSAYQIRTGIRKVPWLLTQGVRDGGIEGEIINQGSLLCCFCSCCHNPKFNSRVFPTRRHYSAKTTQGPRAYVGTRDLVGGEILLQSLGVAQQAAAFPESAAEAS